MTASVKLTNWMRDDLIKAALKDVFSERVQELKIREDGLARAVYETVLSPQDRATIDMLPNGFMKESSSVSARVASHCGSHWANLDFLVPVRVPYQRDQGCWLVVDQGTSFANSYEDFKREQEDYRTELNGLKAKIKALVYSCTTTNSLLTVWPEAARYLPKQPEPVKNLPAVMASDVVASMAAAKAKGRPVKIKLVKGA